MVLSGATCNHFFSAYRPPTGTLTPTPVVNGTTALRPSLTAMVCTKVVRIESAKISSRTKGDCGTYTRSPGSSWTSGSLPSKTSWKLTVAIEGWVSEPRTIATCDSEAYFAGPPVYAIAVARDI